ncbi:hypothetical protein GBAR_LOCUS18436 [Geodia barretti]|uniref:Uncharacterized protein n=1 Tax=Geodia barretti TaxID=519541 RepID=A0AA35SP25_GEOBA|nr:hypothetical protein GBAR_LOCUS18436 [Geodia barretti]
MKSSTAMFCASSCSWLLLYFTAGSWSYPSVHEVSINTASEHCTANDHHLALESGKNCTIQCSIMRADDQQFLLFFYQYEHIMQYVRDPIVTTCDNGSIQKCTGEMAVDHTFHHQHINCLFIYYQSGARFYTNTLYIEVEEFSSSPLPTFTSSIITSKIVKTSEASSSYYPLLMTSSAAVFTTPSPSPPVVSSSEVAGNTPFCYCPSMLPCVPPTEDVTGSTTQPVLASLCLLLSSLLSSSSSLFHIVF